MPKQPSELPEAKVEPSPELERRTRRRFSTEYKLKIVAQTDACRRGEVGQFLRCENAFKEKLNAI